MTSSILRALHVYSSHTMELQRACSATNRLRAVVKPFASMSDSLSRCCFCIVPISRPYSRTVWPLSEPGCSEMQARHPTTIEGTPFRCQSRLHRHQAVATTACLEGRGLSRLATLQCRRPTGGWGPPVRTQVPRQFQRRWLLGLPHDHD